MPANPFSISPISDPFLLGKRVLCLVPKTLCCLRMSYLLADKKRIHRCLKLGSLEEMLCDLNMVLKVTLRSKLML